MHLDLMAGQTPRVTMWMNSKGHPVDEQLGSPCEPVHLPPGGTLIIKKPTKTNVSWLVMNNHAKISKPQTILEPIWFYIIYYVYNQRML